MSRAFDTIKRSNILNLLRDANCTEDDIRLVRFLLSRTKLKVKINNILSSEFESTIGSFQGEMVTITLAGGLNHLRAVVTRPNPPISNLGIPLEWEYADDTDVLDEDLPTLKNLLPTCTTILNEWNLFVNEEKTEFVHVHLANKGDLDVKGMPLLGNDAWRSSVSLGSRLCSIKDIKHRCNLGNVSFQNFKKIWLQGKKIPLEKKLIIYEGQVTSVILYISNS